MRVVAVVRHWRDAEGVTGSRLYLWCPACEEPHTPQIAGPEPLWTWDGNLDAPTVNPSILVQGVQWGPEQTFYKPSHQVGRGEPTICHSFVKAGHWEFLSDCTHTLAGVTVPLPPLPW